MSEENSGDTEKNIELRTTSSSSTIPPASPRLSDSDGSAMSSFNWCAGLGGIGFVETSYLSYLKLTNSDAFCPLGGGGSCGSVLNSEYSVIFGIPLPLIGMVAYGLVTLLGLQWGGKKLPFEIGGTTGRSILLVTTTSMAVASAYFLYILSTQFAGESCLYCVASALLSFSLFFISIKDIGSKEIQKEVILQLCVAALVVTALSASYSTSQPISTSLAETELPFFKTEVTTNSSPLAVALAKHLRSIGAKMYGAFWCSHCQEQKEMFGREAAEILDYVECFPDGYRKGIQIAKACKDVKIEGFPTWIINGQVFSGEQDFSELARASGVKPEDLSNFN